MSHHTTIHRWNDPAALLARTLLRQEHGPNFERQNVAVVPEHDDCAHSFTNVVELGIDGGVLIAGDDPGSPPRGE